MSLLLKLSLVIYAVLVTIYCFQKKFRSQRWLRIFSKMLCSVGFLLVAATCGLESGFRKEPLWSWGIFAALAFSALGDLFLVLQKGEAGRKKFDPFTLGGISFFSAHVLFSAVFVYYRGFHWGTVIAALGLAGIQLGMLARVKRRLDLFSIFSLIYLAALGFMAANGFLFFTGITLEASSPYFLCAAVGAVLFLMSDLLLCYKLFLNGKAEWAEIGNTIAYFGGQALFALTLLYV